MSHKLRRFPCFVCPVDGPGYRIRSPWALFRGLRRSHVSSITTEACGIGSLSVLTLSDSDLAQSILGGAKHRPCLGALETSH